jgi:hypothetical protein
MRKTKPFSAIDRFFAGLDRLSKSPPVRFIVEICAFAVISMIFQEFTASALWLPADWRHIVTFSIALFCTLVAEFCQYLFPPIKESEGKTRKKTRKRGAKQKKSKFILTGVAMLSALACLWGIWSTYALRSDCIYPFSPTPGWYLQQFGRNISIPVLHPDNPSTSTTTAPSQITNAPGRSDVNNHAAIENNIVADSDLNVPDFINRERGTFYLPQHFDPKLESDLLRVGNGDLRQGVVATLDREPMLLVDWSVGTGTPLRTLTTRKFALLHILTLLTLSIAWGLHRSAAEVVYEGITLVRGG